MYKYLVVFTLFLSLSSILVLANEEFTAKGLNGDIQYTFPSSNAQDLGQDERYPSGGDPLIYLGSYLKNGVEYRNLVLSQKYGPSGPQSFVYEIDPSYGEAGKTLPADGFSRVEKSYDLNDPKLLPVLSKALGETTGLKFGNNGDIQIKDNSIVVLNDDGKSLEINTVTAKDGLSSISTDRAGFTENIDTFFDDTPSERYYPNGLPSAQPNQQGGNNAAPGTTGGSTTGARANDQPNNGESISVQVEENALGDNFHFEGDGEFDGERYYRHIGTGQIYLHSGNMLYSVDHTYHDVPVANGEPKYLMNVKDRTDAFIYIDEGGAVHEIRETNGVSYIHKTMEHSEAEEYIRANLPTSLASSSVALESDGSIRIGDREVLYGDSIVTHFYRTFKPSAFSDSGDLNYDFEASGFSPGPHNYDGIYYGDNDEFFQPYDSELVYDGDAYKEGKAKIVQGTARYIMDVLGDDNKPKEGEFLYLDSQGNVHHVKEANGIKYIVETKSYNDAEEFVRTNLPKTGTNVPRVTIANGYLKIGDDSLYHAGHSNMRTAFSTIYNPTKGITSYSDPQPFPSRKITLTGFQSSSGVDLTQEEISELDEGSIVYIAGTEYQIGKGNTLTSTDGRYTGSFTGGGNDISLKLNPDSQYVSVIQDFGGSYYFTYTDDGNLIGTTNYGELFDYSKEANGQSLIGGLRPLAVTDGSLGDEFYALQSTPNGAQVVKFVFDTYGIRTEVVDDGNIDQFIDTNLNSIDYNSYMTQSALNFESEDGNYYFGSSGERDEKTGALLDGHKVSQDKIGLSLADRNDLGFTFKNGKKDERVNNVNYIAESNLGVIVEHNGELFKIETGNDGKQQLIPVQTNEVQYATIKPSKTTGQISTTHLSKLGYNYQADSSSFLDFGADFNAAFGDGLKVRSYTNDAGQVVRVYDALSSGYSNLYQRGDGYYIDGPTGNDLKVVYDSDSESFYEVDDKGNKKGNPVASTKKYGAYVVDGTYYVNGREVVSVDGEVYYKGDLDDKSIDAQPLPKDQTRTARYYEIINGWGQGFADFASYVRGGTGTLSSMLYNPGKVRDEMDRKLREMGNFMGGTNYIENAICQAKIPNPGQGEAFAVDESGNTLLVGYVSGEQIEQEVIIYDDNGNEQSLTSFIYKIEVYVKNSGQYESSGATADPSDMVFSVRIYDSENPTAFKYFYDYAILLSPGETFGRSGFNKEIVESSNVYDTLCVEFKSPIQVRQAKASQSFKEISKICNRIESIVDPSPSVIETVDFDGDGIPDTTGGGAGNANEPAGPTPLGSLQPDSNGKDQTPSSI